MVVRLYASLMSCFDAEWHALGREALQRRVFRQQEPIMLRRGGAVLSPACTR